jgi:L-seryl-tRNA(Ser) seleniumtransferase
MKVHRSNFEVLGFTAEVGIGELARIAHARGALLLHDLGSGMLDAHPAMGRDSVHASLDAGADLVLFSGDKMLGGPQAGIAAGHEDLVMRMRKHPLMRMLRPDKLQLIALEATLLAWERDPLGGEVPAARMLGRGDDELKATAERVLARVVPLLEGRGVEARAERVESTTGGGSAALVRLPSWAVVITPARGAEGGADAALAAALRQGDPCVVGRIEDGRVILDVRTLLDPADEDALVAALGCCASASR